MRICTVPGCSDKHKGRGYCSHHYYFWWRDNVQTDPLKPLPIQPLRDYIIRVFPGEDHGDIANRAQVTRRSVQRWMTELRALSLKEADRIATSLDAHPLEIWGSSYWDVKP